jgi:predicted phosphate transport protein (TIGR00153 family)
VVLARFLPRDEQFFTHFADAADNAAEAGRVLASVIESEVDLERRVRRLTDLETQGDDITHRIFSALHSTFVTPLDRDDIHTLATDVDDLVDDIEEVGERIGLYRLGPSTDTAKLLARIISEQAGFIAEAMHYLEQMGKQQDALKRCILELHRLENEADSVHSTALARLYDGVTEVPALIQAMRWGEIYALLESATDRAERVANTLEGMLLKYA